MESRAHKWVRCLVPLVLVLFPATAAHAQRVPEVFLWFAGASLFAPFVAVPVKVGILRLLGVQAARSRLWSVGALEWVLWFPVVAILLRFGRSSVIPLNLLLVLAAAAWTQKTRLANVSWKSALLLSLPTPLLALALPFLAFGVAAFVESLAG